MNSIEIQIATLSDWVGGGEGNRFAKNNQVTSHEKISHL